MSATVYLERLTAIHEALAEADFDGLLLGQAAYIFHLTGWLPPQWAGAHLLIGPRDVTLISSMIPDEIAPAWDKALDYQQPQFDDSAALTTLNAALRAAIFGAGLAGCALGMDALVAGDVLPLLDLVTFRDARPLLLAATIVKDYAALQAIRAGVTLLERGFAAAAATIRPDVSELQVYGAVYSALAQGLGAPFVLDCVFASGPRTLSTEPQPTNRLLRPGETVLIDLFPNLGGYVADYTRNFVAGQPTAAQLAQHAALEHALSTAAALLRPGVRAAEVDRATRQAIEEAGFGAYAYQHHTGHGFGLLSPEPPWLIPGDHTPLRAGMVIAIEPGIYHPVNGGMRLEGNYIITEDGYQALDTYPPLLTACA